MKSPDAVVRDETNATEEIRAAIQQVCSSSEFRRSEQCKRFLTYICELALSGSADQINEYSLGVEIFHRRADYSPAEDGVVRRQAHLVRKKLDAYYAGEGRLDKIRIEVPVGRYVPVFRLQAAEPPPLSEPSTAPVEPPQRRFWTFAPWAAAVLLTAGAFLAGRWTSREVQETNAAVEKIWGPWLRQASGLTIVLSNSRAAVVHHVQNPEVQDSHPEHYRPDAYAQAGLRQFYQFPADGYLFYRPSKTKTGVGESIAAVALAQMFGRYGVPVRAAESRLLNWADLRSDNFILLGHNEANPWVDKLLHNYPFRLGEGQGVRRYIENTNPVKGERRTYYKEAAATGVEPAVEYGLVSMLPGFDKRHKLLLITGLDGQASQLGAEFLAQPARLQELANSLEALAPGHSGPWHFQAVLRVEVRDHLATRAEVVALRVLER